MTPETKPVFEARDIAKSFGPVQALKGVNVSLNPGEIHSVIGENGAGKSTLMNIICGRLRPTSGRLFVGGAEVSFHSPRAAQAHGIAMAPQEINLVPDLTVAENIVLGTHCARGGVIDWTATRLRAIRHLHELDEGIDHRIKVKRLSKAQQQIVQIVRAVATEAKIVIFDEPTAALTYREEDKLLAYIRALAASGRSVFYISHRLDEVRALSHKVTVFRDGEQIGTLSPEEATRDRMVAMMAGRPPTSSVQSMRKPSSAPTVLEVRALTRPYEFTDVSFDLRKGEILGVSGLVGSGRTELAKCIFGVTRPQSGRVTLEGREVAFASPWRAIEAGLIYLPEDRKQEGIFPLLSIAENTALPTIERFSGWLGILQSRRVRRGRPARCSGEGEVQFP